MGEDSTDTAEIRGSLKKGHAPGASAREVEGHDHSLVGIDRADCIDTHRDLDPGPTSQALIWVGLKGFPCSRRGTLLVAMAPITTARVRQGPRKRTIPYACAAPRFFLNIYNPGEPL